VQITGHHYHNPADPNEFAENGGEAYLRNTLLPNLKFGTVELPPTLEEQRAGIQSKTVTMEELGISFPTLFYVPNVVEERILNPDLPSPLPPGVVIDQDLAVLLGTTGGGIGGGGSMSMIRQPSTAGGQGGPQQTTLRQLAQRLNIREPVITVRRFDFVIQFVWEETPPSVRKTNAEGEGTATTGSTD
jgi:hypothetical protein